MVVPAAWIWNWLPPANSTPKLKPRRTKLRTQISRITPEAKYHRLRVPIKLKLVSPRYSLRKMDISPVLARPSSSRAARRPVRPHCRAWVACAVDPARRSPMRFLDLGLLGLLVVQHGHTAPGGGLRRRSARSRGGVLAPPSGGFHSGRCGRRGHLAGDASGPHAVQAGEPGRAEGLAPRQQGDQRMGEQEDDDQVKDGRQAEGESKAPDVTGGKVVQDRRGQEGHRVGGQDGPPGPHPRPRNSDPERTAVVDFVLYSFEEHHERVGRDTDRDNETSDTGKGQGEADL